MNSYSHPPARGSPSSQRRSLKCKFLSYSHCQYQQSLKTPTSLHSCTSDLCIRPSLSVINSSRPHKIVNILLGTTSPDTAAVRPQWKEYCASFDFQHLFNRYQVLCSKIRGKYLSALLSSRNEGGRIKFHSIMMCRSEKTEEETRKPPRVKFRKINASHCGASWVESSRVSSPSKYSSTTLNIKIKLGHRRTLLSTRCEQCRTQ